MMTQKLFQAFVMTMLVFSGAASAHTAPKGPKITIDVFPYVGTLGTNAADVEQQLAEKAAQVCGSLANVAYLQGVTLKMKNIQASDINPNGVAGGTRLDNSIFSLAYPRVQGSATVVCKP